MNKIRSKGTYKPVHGVSIGIIMLDTRFQRLRGDIGNASTFDFPVQYMLLDGLAEGSSVSATDEMVERFVDTANRLVRLGVDAIATSCGFFSIFQQALCDRISVPVATSSLIQIPMVQRIIPKGRRVGVITASYDKLTPQHFAAVGVPEDTPFEGLQIDGVFRSNLRNGVSPVSYEDHKADILAACDRLITNYPDIGAIVLECTNMPPYARDISQVYGLPVYDAVSLIKWLHAGVSPKTY